MQVFFLIPKWRVPWPVFTPVTSENTVMATFSIAPARRMKRPGRG